MRILVVDDDPILVEVLQRSLASQRYVVDIAEDGQLGWEYVQTGEYELVLLDINLPGLDGVSLCEKIRAQGYTIPILLMTAKNASEDRIRGLDAGADDYLIKPLDLGELNARVRALSRRGEVTPSTILNVNGLTLDPSSCKVRYRQQLIKLTAKEYNLLEIFLRNPTRVFSRSQILDKIWTFDELPLEDSVKAHIKGLRKKLKAAGIADWIENVYGIGYRLNPKANSSLLTLQDPQNYTSVEQEFNRKLEQMWVKYQDKMLERLKVLRNAASIVKKAQLPSQLQSKAERAAHKLAGVLGMFSKDTGTDIARAIETLLQNHQVLTVQQQEEFISLVADLDSLLVLDETSTAINITPTNLLLISADKQLAEELQYLSKTQGLSWQQVDNITEAETWLQDNLPYVVVIDTKTDHNQAEYLALVKDLNTRATVIPTLIISDVDNLSDRLTAVRAGVQSFLVQPVTPSTIWQTINQLLTQNQTAIASILIVDDDEVFLGIISSILEPWGIKVSLLANPSRFWEVLQATQPDLVILDIEMPQINGMELCQALRSDPDWQELPVLFLTARRDAQTIQQVFEIGGDDYISKPVVGAELLARINCRLERSRLLHNLATQDRLTGLTNRIHSSRQIENLLQQAQSFEQPLSFSVLKMTELAKINLQYGHAIGDRILAQWGKVIQAVFRKHHQVTGYWGDGDFIIALANVNKIQAKEQLNELLSIIRKQIFTSPEGERFQVDFDCAIAQFPSDGNTLHSLYQIGVQALSI